MSRYYLFGTEGCHLCEQAEQLLIQLSAPIDYDKKDISEHPVWHDKYATRIPVLFHLRSGEELNWPFDLASLQLFISATSLKTD